MQSPALFPSLEAVLAPSSNSLIMWLVFLVTILHPEATKRLTVSHLVSITRYSYHLGNPKALPALADAFCPLRWSTPLPPGLTDNSNPSLTEIKEMKSQSVCQRKIKTCPPSCSMENSLTHTQFTHKVLRGEDCLLLSLSWALTFLWRQ